MCSNNQKDVTMGNQQRSTYNTTRKKTHNEFVNEIISKYSNQFFILTRYVKNNEKVLFRHNSHECGYHCFFKRPNDILSSNQGCPKCAVEKSRKKQKTFEDEVFKQVGNEYTFIDKYISSTRKIRVLHNICKHIYDVQPNRFLSIKNRCPNCSIRNKEIQKKEFLKKFAEKSNGEYSLLSDYDGTNTKIEIKHIECGFLYSVRPNNFINLDNRCSRCCQNSSKGMKRIIEILTDNDILFHTEYKFSDCKNIHPLPFDFFIPSHNTLIEYDGEHHFKPVKKFGGDEYFNTVQKHDSIKNEYCITNNINLIRIPYTSFKTIDKILEDKIISKRSTTIPGEGVGSSDPKQ